MDAQINNLLVPTCLASGESLKKQRRIVRRAVKRRRFARTIRCKLGKHNPPHDKCFREMGAVMIGGPCTECDDVIVRELVWIGNDWDFFDAMTAIQNQDEMHISAIVDRNKLASAVHAHLLFLHS